MDPCNNLYSYLNFPWESGKIEEVGRGLIRTDVSCLVDSLEHDEIVINPKNLEEVIEEFEIPRMQFPLEARYHTSNPSSKETTRQDIVEPPYELKKKILRSPQMQRSYERGEAFLSKENLHLKDILEEGEITLNITDEVLKYRS